MRLFAAIELPWSVREQLAAMTGTGIPGADWLPPENYHLTLRFIGEVPRDVAADIDEAFMALRAPGFDLVLSGIGTFSKGGVGTSLWAGVEPNPSLRHLRLKIETALQRIGLAPERRRFQAHVTLARLDNPLEFKLASFVQAHNLFRTEPVPIGHFTLFSSVLGKDQAFYTPEVEYQLT